MRSSNRGNVAGEVAAQTKALQEKRVKMIITNLLYFAAMLAISLIMFLKGAGQLIYILVLALLLFYIFAARPMMKGFENDLRRAILSHSVMARLDSGAVYEPKEGIPSDYPVEAGFVNVIAEKGFLSRERITGSKGSAKVEIADVTFPFHENGLNKMFSGCFIRITRPGADYKLLDVKAGDVKHIESERERKLARKLGEFIPGSLYLHREGDRVDVLLRGRFVGFQINPLGEVHENTLMSDPLPELGEALELAGL